MKINVITAPYVRVRFHKDILYVAFGSIQLIVRDTQEQHKYLKILSLAKKPIKVNQLVEKLSCELDYSADSIFQTVHDLIRRNFLLNETLYNKNDRYSRNHLYYLLNGYDPSVVQTKIRHSHVAILGCGGIGNFISYGLVGAGIGHLTLIDDDIIERSNITRQVLFSNRDIGKKKSKF